MYKFEKHLTFGDMDIKYPYQANILNDRYYRLFKISMFGIMKGKGGLYEKSF